MRDRVPSGAVAWTSKVRRSPAQSFGGGGGGGAAAFRASAACSAAWPPLVPRPPRLHASASSAAAEPRHQFQIVLRVALHLGTVPGRRCVTTRTFPGYLSLSSATWPPKKSLPGSRSTHLTVRPRTDRLASPPRRAPPCCRTDRKTTTEGCFQAFPHATTAASRSLFNGTASLKRTHGRASFLSSTLSTSQSSQSPTS